MADDGTRKYHLAKTLSWRVLASLTTFALAWLLTGDMAIGATIGGSEAVVKMVLYYVHERAWHRLSEGRV